MIELSCLYKDLITKFQAMKYYFPKKKTEMKLYSWSFVCYMSISMSIYSFREL